MHLRYLTERRPVSGHRFAGFVLISGTGWLIDALGLLVLVAAGVPLILANAASAGLAVSFVFLVAQRRIFTHDGTVMHRRFVIYLCYNALAILAASLAIAGLAGSIVRPVATVLRSAARWVPEGATPWIAASMIAKVAVTPFTLYANFLFMRWLLERHAPPARAASTDPVSR